jgi:hypothetical protein
VAFPGALICSLGRLDATLRASNQQEELFPSTPAIQLIVHVVGRWSVSRLALKSKIGASSVNAILFFSRADRHCDSAHVRIARIGKQRNEEKEKGET